MPAGQAFAGGALHHEEIPQANTGIIMYSIFSNHILVFEQYI